MQDDVITKPKSRDEELVNVPEIYTINFREPIEALGKTISSLELSEPKIQEMQRAYKHIKGITADAESMMKYRISLISDVAKRANPDVLPQHCEKMKVSQLNEASTYLENFTQAGLQTIFS